MSLRGPELDRLLVWSDQPLQAAMMRLQETGKGVVLHVDKDGRLLHTVTDGDIRRLLLAGCTLDNRIGEMESRTPITAPRGTATSEILAILDRYLIDQLPLLDDAGRPVELYLRRDLGERIWLSTPHMGDEEMRFVRQAFETNWIAPLGPNVDAFERDLEVKTGVAHAAALSSGTAAIHLALILLGVKAGDRVLCSALTFAASSNPILYLGAEPVFIDAEADSWNMCPKSLERALEASRLEGRLPKAVIVVDLYGQPANYDAIIQLCQFYGVPIVEDAAEALGASYKGRQCGGFGKIGTFSFNGNKIITTSGGGMLVSDDEDIVRHARKLATQAREDVPWYEHVELGFNYRMSNVLAGIGRGQLARLEDRVASRRAVFDRYVEVLAHIEEIQWMPELSGSFSNRWLTTCTLPANIDPQTICEQLARIDIEVRRVWKPMHVQPLYRGSRFFNSGANHDVASDLFARGLCLPSGSNMTIEQVDRVCDALGAAVKRAQRTSAVY